MLEEEQSHERPHACREGYDHPHHCLLSGIGFRVCVFWFLVFGFLVLRFVFWVLGFGVWVLGLGFGFWVSGFVFWVLSFGFWVLGSGFEFMFEGSGFRLLGLGSRLQGSGNAKCYLKPSQPVTYRVAPHGYLAHKTQPPPLRVPYGPRFSPAVGS